jgi:hypothetical protein
VRAKLLAVAAVLAAGGCTADGPGTAPDAPGPTGTATASAVPAPPQPSFADLTRGSTTSVVKMYAYDARHDSAVVEPIIFMTGGEFCRTFALKSSDPRCDHEWTTEESHTKITMPVAPKPAFTTWDDGQGGVCIGSPAAGGTCPMSARAFARWLAEQPGSMVSITTRNGTVTRMAQIYTP